MWKSGWKLEKSRIQGREKWLILVISGVLLLLIAVPTGWTFGGNVSSGEVGNAGGITGGIGNAGGIGTSGGMGTSGENRNPGGPGKTAESSVPARVSLSGAAGEEASAVLSGNGQKEIRLYEQELEQRVKDILKHVEGIGEVDVMITLRSSGERIFQVDQDKNRSSTEEKDSSGGTRKVLTEEIREESVMSGSGSAQEPVLIKELEPEIAGIIISAQGGGSASVKAEISDAMEALFGLPAHKIKVLKRAE